MRTALALSVLALTHFLMLHAGYLEYEIWSQIDYLSKLPFGEFTTAGAALHAPRYFVVMPSYILGEMFSVDSDSIFGVYVVVLATATAGIWIATQTLFVRSSRHRTVVWITPFILLHFINGRFAFALFGLSLMVWLLILIKLRRIQLRLALPLLFTSMLYSSVSSGVFSVAVTLLLLELRTEVRYFLGAKVTLVWRTVRFIGVFLMFASLMYFAYSFLLKNINFYGGGFEGAFGMVSHGFGLLLNPEPVLENCATSVGVICTVSVILVNSVFAQITALIMFPALIVILAAMTFALDISPMAKRILTVSAVGGVFGFTTLMCSLVSLPLLVRKGKTPCRFHQ
jgi:hypothetical protein